MARSFACETRPSPNPRRTGVVEYGGATRAELEEVAGGFRAWAGRPDGTFVVVHGEIVARAPLPSEG